MSMLELANLETLVQRSFYYKTKEDNKFKVKKIVSHHTLENGEEYLIK